MTNNNKVYAVKCSDYKYVDLKLKELFKMMGGISLFVKKGEKVILKPNLLQGTEPEKAVTTHPEIIMSAGRLVKEAGGKPLIADSPGAGYKYNKKTLEKIYKDCSIFDSAVKNNIKLNYNTEYKTVFYPEGKLIKRFEIIEPVLNADCVFNLCKLKTHVLMHMTCAIKNNFGVIPGLSKPGYHAKLDNKMYFAGMLLDLSAYVSPIVTIVDAIVGLEGEGPGSSGHPRQVGWILASVNQLALDVVAGEMMGIKQAFNPVLKEAENRGMFPVRLKDVEIIGAEISKMIVKDYKKPVSYAEGTKFTDLAPIHKIVEPLLKTGTSLKPVILKDKCIKCGVCIKACPVNAIKYYKNQYAKIIKQECIRCYCCHEMCQSKAVKLKKSVIYRILNLY